MIRRSATVLALIAALVVAVPTAQATSLTCDGLPATIVGTDGADVLVGSAGPDVIVGLGGNDHISGGGGDDVICGGPGRDNLSGGGGDDHLNGGTGRDRLAGNVGDDLLLGGAGRDVLRAGTGRDRSSGGRNNDWCSEAVVVRRCEVGPGVPAVSPPPVPPPLDETSPVERVIHVSIDGLRSDAVASMPNLSALVSRAASTLNARTDPESTRTLPNHSSQVTGRFVTGTGGHGITYNEDMGRTIHDEAGGYVTSVFDVVHDSGGRTTMWVGKPKFEALDRSYDATHGAPDIVGVDHGSDKIDVFVRTDPVEAVELFLDDLAAADVMYSFVHVRSPDEFGHISGWDTPGYDEGVAEADGVIGRILTEVDANPAWADTTAIIVTSDHGGATGATDHGDSTDPANYTIPFAVWAPDVTGGSDLYALNPTTRTDPGVGRPPATGPQPIRGHDAANLALSLLGLPGIPGSQVNAAQDLRIS